mmetsp:Transcript_23969/g.77136  ORF Transcript_23969/g.77136 Transcript_23969/m.77136 type:complete len:102 (+) Transcript_23969:59-364(+)
MRRMLLLRCFSLLWLVSSSAALKVSLEGTVATLDLHAGDEFVAPRRSLLGCAATGDDDDEDDEGLLVDEGLLGTPSARWSSAFLGGCGGRFGDFLRNVFFA